MVFSWLSLMWWIRVKHASAVVALCVLPLARCFRAGKNPPSRVSASFFSAKTAILTILTHSVQNALLQLTVFIRELANLYNSIQLKYVLLALV